MSNYKYIVISDLDGTLCNSQGDLSPKTLEFLRKFQEKRKDVFFTFSTGRTWADAKGIYEALSLQSYISCLNGAYIYNPKTNHLIFSSLSLRFVKYLLYSPRVLSLLHSGSILTTSNSIEIDSSSPLKTFEACRESSLPIVGIKLFYKENHFFEVREIIQKIKAFDPLPKVGLYFHPGFVNLELQSAEKDKSSFVEFISNYLAVPKSNILVFGDNHNDIPMMKGGVRSYSLSNSLFLLHQESQIISKFSNDEDGVIKELEAFFGPV